MKSLENQEDKLGQLREHAATLVSKDHYESPAIITRRYTSEKAKFQLNFFSTDRDAVFTRYSRLKQQSKQRMKKLHDSKQLQLFLQEITEV